MATVLSESEGGYRDVRDVAIENVIITLFQLPGYLLCALLVDRVGRVRMQMFGFLAVGVLMFIGLAIGDSLWDNSIGTMIFFSVSQLDTRAKSSTLVYIDDNDG